MLSSGKRVIPPVLRRGLSLVELGAEDQTVCASILECGLDKFKRICQVFHHLHGSDSLTAVHGTRVFKTSRQEVLTVLV